MASDGKKYANCTDALLDAFSRDANVSTDITALACPTHNIHTCHKIGFGDYGVASKTSYDESTPHFACLRDTNVPNRAYIGSASTKKTKSIE